MKALLYFCSLALLFASCQQKECKPKEEFGPYPGEKSCGKEAIQTAPSQPK